MIPEILSRQETEVVHLETIKSYVRKVSDRFGQKKSEKSLKNRDFERKTNCKRKHKRV